MKEYTGVDAVELLNTLFRRYDRLNGTQIASKRFDAVATEVFQAVVGRKPTKEELAEIAR